MRVSLLLQCTQQLQHRTHSLSLIAALACYSSCAATSSYPNRETPDAVCRIYGSRQPLSIAHCNTCWWPRSAAFVHVSALGSQPLQQLEVASLRSSRARLLGPGAAVLMCPLQHLQVTAARGCVACRPSPVAPVCSRPLQQRQVTTQCCEVAGAPV
jgi:hypothetical protein